MFLEDLLKGCNVSGDYCKGTEISGVCCDSRLVKPGDVFIAMKGEKTDGGLFIREAVKNGAACIVSERELREGFPNVQVDNVRRACAVMYSNFYGDPARDMKTVAVTGTNGKTTVASLLWHVFESDGRKTGLVGTVTKRTSEKSLEDETWDNMTTPTPDKLYKYIYEMKKDGCDHLILEASSHGLALSRLDGIHVDVGVFTNLSPEHLDFHGTMENYYASKRRLCETSETMLVNYDDPYGKRLCGEFLNAYAVSAIPETAADSRVWATGAMYRSRGLSGIEYMFCCKDTVFPVKSSMIGKNALYNTLSAVSAALIQGISPEVITAAVESFKGVKGRFETVCSGKGVPVCIIDYAHTPDSFEKVLVQTRSLMKRGSKLFLVFGCGGERDRLKRSVMGRTAEKYADTVILTNDNPRGEDPETIISQICSGMKYPEKVYVIYDREEALHFSVEKSTFEDVILVLGKGHEEYIIDRLGKRPFSERKILRKAVSEKYGGFCP